MSVIQILFRVDEICKKYEKYDVDKQRERNATGDDAFAHIYDTIESDIEKVIHKSEMVAMETNRAKAVAMNAEIRRTKARLLEDVAKLQKLAYKKVKGLSKDDMVARGDLAIALGERIQGIPDGGNNAKNDGWASSSNPNNIKFDMQGGTFIYSLHTMQDEGLDIISEGLETLKNLAHDMNEELDRQVPLVDEIDTKVDKANTDLKNNNVRLKQTLHQVLLST
uniref:t-SNARE coiled-coil homology domain-containing protein n=1 Tax=Chenopodium quinoa TaxID=63459 RepID=A0A803N313_CHEQI